MLDANMKTQLQGYLTRLQHPIELVAALDDGAKSVEVRELLEEIKGLSDKISLREEADAGVRRPSFVVQRVGQSMGIRFAGIPLGHEFTSLVLALLQAGGHPPKVDAEVIEQIKGLSGRYEFEVFISLSCHNCPDVVQALNLMAVLNPNVRATTIDGALFQAEIDARQIMGVPTVFLNGQPFSQGRMTLEEIVAKLDSGAVAREAEKISAKAPFDVLVVGGGPAGSAAAIYAARKGIRTGVLAERFGGQVMDTLGIENFISVRATEGPKLAMALEEHVKEYGVDIMNLQRAQALKMIDGGVEVTLENGAVVKSKTVVLATGARWRNMNVPGEAEFRTKGVAYCPHCDGPLFKGKRVAVIGGGNSGVEAAIDLAGIVAHVTLLEFDSQLRADAVLQSKLRSLPNVTIITSAQTTQVTGTDKVNGLNYKDRATSEVHHLALEGIFVQIGLVPNTDWLKGVINLSPRGEIEVDAKGQTSMPGVFAAGDCTTVPYKQIVIAMGEGAKASLSAFDHLIRHSVPA
ncbi:MAG: alkyl hydroperoxide reductase subunit F [Candidatus Dactylopiibacterium carminicum]|uniref:Alkyl hydroperoxide reductase subunit F n=1 Tax=Candidatus Dactylopiibacterium carminicum TaxID=857335 RepID=A0A272ERA0_9RHOO|nr:alkyl hydroperoxide reductase subunit F [Candidatus Dactylopiibacterium carminicum]KAF7598725.1 alkyl hydroperoxide reductase subunit F [Candidatus Dactylopiibacterium carminicum]PAS92637.1 MAG: alkyl hydroperoxide reductase subunit F [Candidatus Dactylopiibacterium carminicum]PAS96127.1 MAG: alkyl hydroperoxide reductase subunit F [Candidatus Dactylopiibacterium carminicum]PAS98744.1 MAG: alkyl hydroperoxide reductase subunit F [Candidatus Dactylopiibacterium carminicum]